MERSHILCPNCMKVKLLSKEKENMFCAKCNIDFIRTGKNSIRYK